MLGVGVGLDVILDGCLVVVSALEGGVSMQLECVGSEGVSAVLGGVCDALFNNRLPAWLISAR